MLIFEIEYERSTPSFRMFEPAVEDYILVLTKSEMIFHGDGKQLRKPAGQVILYRPGKDLDLEGTEKNMIFDYIRFRLSSATAQTVNALPLPFESPVTPPNFHEVSNLVRILWGLFHSVDRYKKEKSYHHFMNLIYAIANGDVGAGRSSPVETMYIKMCDLRKEISDHPKRFRTTQEAADHLGISLSRFAHLYKEFYGITFTNDLIRLRVKHACIMLKTTAWTVSRIAQELGYKTEVHFYRQFKNETGFTPIEYRKAKYIQF